MSELERGMKQKGETKVWKSVLGKNGAVKKISQTQLGQQLLLEESIRLKDLMRDWIDNKSSKLNRKEMNDFFKDDQILLQKIMDILLLLSFTSFAMYDSKKFNATRHKEINIIRKRLFPDFSFDIVWRFVEVLIDYSNYFEIDRSTYFKKDKVQSNVRYICTLPEIVYKKTVQQAHIAFFPEPITESPLDWHLNDEGVAVGGYHHFQYDMIRIKIGKPDFGKFSRAIFDSVNYIQSVKWRVNSHIVNIVDRDLKMPLREDFVKTIYPDGVESQWDVDIKNNTRGDLNIQKIEEARDIYTKAVELYNAECQDYESAVGKYRATQLAVGIAKRYMESDVIYFPHSYDSRGRVYPISVGLSPQGSDAVKAMIEYKNGEVLTEDGEKWAWAYLASLYGDDKLHFEERVLRGKELIDASYLEADEPYQFLAHQLELKMFLDNPKMEFRGRVHLDACNSGSQFTSIITGDRAGCIATNVIPIYDENGIQIRQDAYLLVSDKSLELTKERINENDDEEKNNALEVFKTLLEEKGRKICKTPVMVSNYGGTAGGRSEIIWNMLRELDVDREFITKRNASMFSSIIGDSITGVLNGGKAFETYIHKMNNVIAKKGKAVTWTTSDGFFVTHIKQKELKPNQVQCLLPNSRKKTVIYKKNFSEDINPVKMKSAISPNYIHSLDAELLRRVALKMQQIGIYDTDWIHDSFGCHPNHVDKLLYITKNEFKAMMLLKPLEALDRELRNQADDSKATIKLLNSIILPNLNGIEDNSDYNLVMKSEWFFS